MTPAAAGHLHNKERYTDILLGLKTRQGMGSNRRVSDSAS
jgi:hypothetical protein